MFFALKTYSEYQGHMLEAPRDRIPYGAQTLPGQKSNSRSEFKTYD